MLDGFIDLQIDDLITLTKCDKISCVAWSINYELCTQNPIDHELYQIKIPYGFVNYHCGRIGCS